jgi:hypothetical protein
MGLQGLEIAGVLALLVIVVALLWPWLTPWRLAHPSSFWPVLGVLLGVTAGLLTLVLIGDLFPDRFEAIGRILLLVGVVGGGLLLALREASSA